jgi:DNA-binding SARP family transcriptional activator
MEQQPEIFNALKAEKLRLSILSDWKLEFGNREIHLRGLKRRALLTYLVFKADRPSHRDDLAELLWTSVELRKARASLRQALTDLRKLLGVDVFKSEGEFISIPNRFITTDILELTKTLQGSEEMSKQDVFALRGMAGLMRAFDGVSPLFDDWLSESRARLFDIVLDAATTHLQDQNVPLKARLMLARVVLELDPLHEVAIRAQMQALAHLNDNAAALRVYHGFYNRIEEELAVEPSIETQDIAIKIKMQIPKEDAELVSATPAPGSPRPLTLVAVLPFEKRGDLGIPDYMILGILDQITCKLATFRSPAVISSNSTRQFLGQPSNPMEIARKLDARYVVSGSIYGDGPTPILSVQMCDGANGRVCWAKNLSLNMMDVLTQSLSLAEEIARAIEPSFNLAELKRARSLPPESLEPHHLVLQAKDFMFRMSPPEFLKARSLLDQALDLEMGFAPAFSLSAEWYAINLWQGWSHDSKSESEMLVEHVRQAMQHSPGDGRAMAQWAHHKVALERDFDGALSLINEAQKLAPSDSETLIWTVPTLAQSGRAKQAVQNGSEALRLSPFDPFKFRNEHFLSLAYYANEEFDAAAKLGLACYAKAPNYGSNLRITIAALNAGNRKSEAVELVNQHAKAEPHYSLTRVRDKMGFRDEKTQDTYVSRLLSSGIAE